MRRANIINAKGDIEADKRMVDHYKRSINSHKEDIERLKLKYKSE